MTILAAVKTGTDLVISSDSKITTLGLGGFNNDGSPIWLEQTYDYGTKIAFSQGNYWTTAVAGQVSFGDIKVVDIIEEYRQPVDFNSRIDQEKDLDNLINKINYARCSKYTEYKYPKEFWPYTELLFFSSDLEGRGVRAWHVGFQSDIPKVTGVLERPNIYLSGSCQNALTLLYDYNFRFLDEVSASLSIPPEEVDSVLRKKYIPPIVRFNLEAMPIQDAIDLAVFLVKVQILMERFLPGTPKCGGPIDLAVVHGRPKHTVSWFPGKKLIHPELIK